MAASSIYEIHDPRFRQMIVTSAGLDELYSGCRWAKGPVGGNDANQRLWSDIPNQRMMR
ncbi:SMP-30/gluconolactonase/LRE family protein, partial [Rhizobium leguminosarum]